MERKATAIVGLRRFGEPGRTRTGDPMIKSHVLYRLSYGLRKRMEQRKAMVSTSDRFGGKSRANARRTVGYQNCHARASVVERRVPHFPSLVLGVGKIDPLRLRSVGRNLREGACGCALCEFAHGALDGAQDVFLRVKNATRADNRSRQHSRGDRDARSLLNARRTDAVQQGSGRARLGSFKQTKKLRAVVLDASTLPTARDWLTGVNILNYLGIGAVMPGYHDLPGLTQMPMATGKKM